jgi:hypothetical protein
MIIAAILGLLALFTVQLSPAVARADVSLASRYDLTSKVYDISSLLSLPLRGPASQHGPTPPGSMSADWAEGVLTPRSGVAAETAGEIPAVIYRDGGKSPSNFRLREGESALSFRDSMSNPLPPGHAVLRPGKDWVGIDTSKLPRGSVVPDGVPGSELTPPGHVSVYVNDPELLKAAIIESGRFPK